MWDGGAWENIEDNRSTPYWLPEDTYESEERYMTELGPLPEDALLERPSEPDPTLEEAQAAKITELDDAATTSITVGFWYTDEEVYPDPLHYSYDSNDQLNFSDTASGAILVQQAELAGIESGLPSSISWNGYTDKEHANLVSVVFNATQFLTFWSYVANEHKNAILTKVRALKVLVGEATSLEEVNLITWPKE